MPRVVHVLHVSTLLPLGVLRALQTGNWAYLNPLISLRRPNSVLNPPCSKPAPGTEPPTADLLLLPGNLKTTSCTANCSISCRALQAARKEKAGRADMVPCQHDISANKKGLRYLGPSAAMHAIRSNFQPAGSGAESWVAAWRQTFDHLILIGRAEKRDGQEEISQGAALRRRGAANSCTVFLEG